MSQHIPHSELQAAVGGDGGRLAAAVAECVRGDWLLVALSGRRSEPHYSLLAAARRGVADLRPRLH